MIGANALRSIARDVRAAAVRYPSHVDDLRFLLSLRKPNDFSAYDAHADHPQPAVASTPFAALNSNKAKGRGKGAAQSRVVSAAAYAAACRMSADGHAVYERSSAELLAAARQLSTSKVTPAGDGAEHGDDDSVADEGDVVESSAVVPPLVPSTSSSADDLLKFFWVKKRLAPLRIGDCDGGVSHSAEDSADAAAESGIGKRGRKGESRVRRRVVDPSDGTVLRMPLSACAAGAVDDLIHSHRIDAFPFAERFFGGCVTTMATNSSAVTSSPSNNVAEANAFDAYRHITMTLPAHASVTADSFILAVHANAVEPYYRPPAAGGGGDAVEDVADIVPEASLPRFDLCLNFIMTGRHANSAARLAIINTHLFVLECDASSAAAVAGLPSSAPNATALVEHVGLVDAESLLSMPLPSTVLGLAGGAEDGRGGAAAGGELLEVERGASSGGWRPPNSGAVRQHTVALRLMTATGEGAVGAVKGRIFYKLVLDGDDEGGDALSMAPVRCVEFDAVPLRSADSE